MEYVKAQALFKGSVIIQSLNMKEIEVHIDAQSVLDAISKFEFARDS